MLTQFVRASVANHLAATFTCSYLTIFNRCKSNTTLDYSRYPVLNEAELEETFIRGSGPGGQATNKTCNCVLLRHMPTNILVKCHIHRTTYRNRAEARKILLEKLDAHFNGEYAIAAQIKALEAKKSNEKKRRQNKLNELKKNWKAREKQIADDQKDL